MANITITNNDLGSVEHRDCRYQDETLNLSGAQTVAAGQILARDSVSLKLVNYVPGGAALKSTGDGPFNLTAGDTIVIDVNNVGNATCTWDAAAATITDTTTYAVTDQDTKTMTVTITGGAYDGEVQTVTFSGATTTAAAVAAGINAQVVGCSAAVVGGQVKLTTDGQGTDYDIATGAGTGDLTWGSSTAGTGDVGDIDAVTATEVKTVIEADSTATVTVSGDAAVIKATTELDFISGAALSKLGLSVETITANENGIPKAVMPYELSGANNDNYVRVIIAGEVREDKLSIADGTTVTKLHTDLLRNYGIASIDVSDLNIQDNQ